MELYPGIEAGGDVASDFGRLMDRLIACLESHVSLHRGLLALLERKKSAMVQARLEELEHVLAAEREAIVAIGESERERIALTAEIGSALGLPPRKRPRLLDLLQRARDEHREPLLDLRDELRDLADGLDRVNDLNRTLVLQSLEHIHLFLSLLSGKDPKAKIYSKAGGEEGGADSILVDRRI